ncbi:hypothetical protein A4F85_04845 [Delftia sp. GW456-R20]|uniref:hypothetical protein n=1 Tax=Delftia sp. GW456-R20 TaxID=1827145 RepID=UPI0007AE6C7A|nr:hypothetical protein [Delftia sp. GW456-R20]KZK32043.1 hypothetical protein A4F85_04845 [Delftia sp. GW456-R20]
MSKSEIEEAFHLAQAVFAAGLLARTMTAMQAVQDAATQPEHDGPITIPAATWRAFASEHASVLQQIQLQGLQAPDLPH